VLGRFPSRGPWGELPLVVDTSAWARARAAEVRAQWIDALHSDRLRLSPLARLEILLTARDGHVFDELAEELAVYRAAPLTATVVRAAQDGMRALAHRSAGSHRLPIVDYLVAASAQEIGGAVLHYDHDYDLLAEVFRFESIWLAPAGSLA
jgi:predicted nucleic acid-binding protein